MNNYKNYILPLVFLKHLSERYEVVRDELKDLMKDPKSNYYTHDREEPATRLDLERRSQSSHSPGSEKRITGKSAIFGTGYLLKEVIEQAEWQYGDCPLEA